MGISDKLLNSTLRSVQSTGAPREDGVDDRGDRVERVWLAVLAHLAENGIPLHAGCESDPPNECEVYGVIADAMGTEE